MSCKKDCGGCSCHTGNAPCSHCTEDHNNIDNYPECPKCGEIFYDKTDMEQLKHHINEFDLI